MSKKVAIVDDDVIFQFTTKIKFEKLGLVEDVMIFNDGKEAIQFIQSGDKEDMPEILLLDINMPILDGWQFLDEFLYLESSKKPIIYIVTSSENPVDIEKANQYDMKKNYIVKPISVKKLTSLFDLDET